MRGERFGRRRTSSAVSLLVLIVAASSPSLQHGQRIPPFRCQRHSRRPRLGGGISSRGGGPDLGETWTTEPDPTVLALDDGAGRPDQYLVMLGDRRQKQMPSGSRHRSRARSAAHRLHRLWKVLVAPVTDVSAWAGRLALWRISRACWSLRRSPRDSPVGTRLCAGALRPGVRGRLLETYDMIGLKLPGRLSTRRACPWPMSMLAS